MTEPRRHSAPLLLPSPRHIELTGKSVPLDAPLLCTHAPDLPPQGFTLEIAPAGIVLRCADTSGERYGRTALRQLRAHYRDTLPGVYVRDWPDYPVRGYMLDISRDRVPTRATLERIVDLLDLLRINHLQLYTEHTFAYRAHEAVWRDASPMTPADIQWLDALCSARGIELAANQNGFGHMERWLRHAAYEHLAETPGGWTTSWGARWPAAVLHPDDRAREFVLGLYRELRPWFSSRRININFDETFELGKGRSCERVAAEGRGRVYFDFLQSIVTELQRDGAEVLFWADVLRKHPELIAEFPARDLVALVWHYEAPVAAPALPAGLEEILAEVGIDESVLRGFAGQVPAVAGTGVPFWVCPGTSSWNSLLGRWSNAKSNLIDAATTGLAYGAQGYLITDWGDNGHMQPPSASFAPLAYGACIAWCCDSNRDLDIAAALDAFVFDDRRGRLGTAIVRAAEVYRQSGAQAFNGSPLFYPLVGKDGAFLGGSPPDAAGIARVLDELAAADRDIAAATPRCIDGEIIQRELRQAIRLCRIGAAQLARRHRLAVDESITTKAEIAAALEEQRACWLARSRPGGLEDSLAKLVLPTA
jgi:hypothetical protein